MLEQVENLTGKGSLWFSESAATYSDSVDFLFYLLFYGSVALFLSITAVLFFFIIRYRRKTENQKALSQITHNTKLEITWTIIPLIIVVIIFYFGFKGYIKLSLPPKEDLVINVRAQKWFWTFAHQNGANVANELVVPIHKNIKLRMTSADVLHSFFIPSFRNKKDVLPNYYTTLWFNATKLGTYQVFCAEYCGDQHSTMLASIKVVSQDEYEAYLEKISSEDVPFEELGERISQQRCIVCHSIDGSKTIGPTWKDAYGKKRLLESGKKILYDENYIRESILNPQTKIAKDFAPVMPSFAGQLKEREIEGIIEYIKKIK